MQRGYYEIGIYHPKTPANVGTLWRSAYQLGASGLFVIGHRYAKQASDTVKAWRHVPFREFATLDAWQAAVPRDAVVVGIERGGTDLWGFQHPERAIYLLGAEDDGLSPAALERCHLVVSLDAVRQPSYNVAVSGSIVLYHRCMQKERLATPPRPP